MRLSIRHQRMLLLAAGSAAGLLFLSHVLAPSSSSSSSSSFMQPENVDNQQQQQQQQRRPTYRFAPAVKGILPSSAKRQALPLLRDIPAQIDFVSLSTSHDYDRMLSSVASFCQFFDFAGLRTWYVIVPDSDVSVIRANLPSCHQHHPRMKGPISPIPFKLVAESQLVPELEPRVSRRRRKLRGYQRQMLLKLAAAKIVDGFYLVLDSDVYAFRPFSIRDLFVIDEEKIIGRDDDVSSGDSDPLANGKRAEGESGANVHGERIVRARLDLEHPWFANPENWFADSADALHLGQLRRDTREVCRSTISSTSPMSSLSSSSLSSSSSSSLASSSRLGPVSFKRLFDVVRIGRDSARAIDIDRPFRLYLLEDGRPSSPSSSSSSPSSSISSRHGDIKVEKERVIFGACLGNRDLNIGFTPMILHASVIVEHLIPTLERLYNGDETAWWTTKVTWTDALISWHFRRQGEGLISYLLRIMGIRDEPAGGATWTEYGLYFYAAVAAGTFDKLHAVGERFSSPPSESGEVLLRREGGILEYSKSIMNYSDYDRGMWASIFDEFVEGSDAFRPFFLVHSWMGKPIADINRFLAPFVPEIALLVKGEEE